MFYTDGRGFFVRAVNGTTKQVGSIGIDQMRPITGSFGARDGVSVVSDGTSLRGMFEIDNEGGVNLVAVQTGATGKYIKANSALLGPNYDGEETVPLYVGMTPAICLGV